MKAVLFDLDGTLLDRDKSLLAFLNWQASGMLSHALLDKTAYIQRFLQLDDHGRVWKDQVYAELIEEFDLSRYSVSELVNCYRQCFKHFCRPYPSVEKTLKSIKKMGMKMAVVTNGYEQFQQDNFSALGFDRLISAVVVSETVASRKPEAAIFQCASTTLGVAVEDCIFVGDSVSADIIGANALGMYSVYCGKGNCAQADAVVTELSQLLSVIKSLRVS